MGVRFCLVKSKQFKRSRADFERAATILEANGYESTHEKYPTSAHYLYEKDGVVFELHRRLPTVREDDDELSSLFETGIDNRVWRTIDGVSFPTLPTDLNGLVFHINQHIREGLGLKQIVDWMLYLHANRNWDALLPTLQKTGLEKLALTVTATCQKYLGLEKIVEESEDLPCDDFMEYVMEKGDMGRKGGQEGKIESVFLDMASPVRIFRRLQTGGLRRWKAAREHYILRPIAWLYQIGFIARELIRAKATPGKILTMRKVGLEQRDLIKRLGLDLVSSIDRRGD